jgi:hypothetical protein
MEKQLCNNVKVYKRLLLTGLLLFAISLTTTAQKLKVTSANVTTTTTPAGLDQIVTTTGDLAADGNVVYASEFGEPIESGASTTRGATITGASANASDNFAAAATQAGFNCSGYISYAQAIAFVESVGGR